MKAEINWTQTDERHHRAETEFGTAWIRTDRAGRVSGIYLCGVETQKWVPESEEEETLSGAKVIVELLLSGTRAAREIGKNASPVC